MAIQPPVADAEEFASYVQAIMDGLSRAPATAAGGDAIDGTLAMSSMLYVIAAMVEAHPGVADDAAIPAVAKGTVTQLTMYIKTLRSEYRKSGQHVWEVLNVPAKKRH